MSSGIQVMGAPPTSLGFRVERLFAFLEAEPGNGQFSPIPWLGNRMTWHVGVQDDIPHATIALGLAPNLEAHGDFTDHLRDWQLLDGGSIPINAWEALLGGRRVQIRTAREQPGDDWVAFEGFVERLEHGWSGSAKDGTRSLTLIARSTIIAADREPGQFMFGQWRRSWRAERALRSGGGEFYNECVRVTGLPCVFNSGGRPNRHAYPLVFGDEPDKTKTVYVFCDPDDPNAVPWNLAAMFRYVQWAAMQPAPPTDPDKPYDTEYTSSLRGLSELHWTSYHLKHANLNALVAGLIEHTTPGGGPTLRELALLRAPGDIALENMSALEALLYLCDRAGMLCYVDHAYNDSPNPNEPAFLTRLNYMIHGDRNELNPATGDEGPGRGGGDGGRGRDPELGEPDSPVQPRSARGVFLHLPSDRTFEAGTGTTVDELFGRFNVAEGALLADESGVRTSVLVSGDPTQYEGAWELRPGWLLDDWVDIDPNDEDAVKEAIARILTEDWRTRYQLDRMIDQKTYGRVLRFWVLNEDGGFDVQPGQTGSSPYKRAHGPWSTDAAWWPYRFRTEAEVADLANRGDKGFSCRRRRFLAPIAQATEVEDPGAPKVAIIVQLSYNNGVNWTPVRAKFVNEAERCAIYIQTNDLAAAELREPVGARLNMPEAYIRGWLRVRVMANVEGDDAARGFANPSQKSFVQTDLREFGDRRGQLRRILRSATKESWKNYDVADGRLPYPDDIDDSLEGTAEAERVRNELEQRRHSGQVTIPWIARDGAAAYDGYRPGDEVLGVKTGRDDTFMPLHGSDHPWHPAARIIGLTYNYSGTPDEQSTTLHLDQRMYGLEDVVGSPDVAAEED